MPGKNCRHSVRLSEYMLLIRRLRSSQSSIVFVWSNPSSPAAAASSGFSSCQYTFWHACISFTLDRTNSNLLKPIQMHSALSDVVLQLEAQNWLGPSWRRAFLVLSMFFSLFSFSLRLVASLVGWMNGNFFNFRCCPDDYNWIILGECTNHINNYGLAPHEGL